MEGLFIYILKSSGLIVSFFLAYHFLLRKETFFNNNRWFLLSGLFISASLPLYFIKKVVLIEKPKLSVEDLLALANHTKVAQSYTEVTPQIEPVNWLEIAFIGYLLITAILFIKVVFDLISLFKLLNKNKIKRQNGLSYIDMQEDIAPFSFFNFIVFNSSLYSQHELESILSHEKIHSKQKHSFDVLFAKLFTIVFWFNPFIWLYKKAIIQNLEYIADNQAIQLIEDKKCYQMALLKIVSHQNCLPITNHFYQSLIKKRIVMLNKNQSHKRNIWKYTVVIPALIAFVFLFQVKVEAQQKEDNTKNIEAKAILTGIEISKTDTEEDLLKTKNLISETKNIEINFSEVKRNSKEEITHIRIDFNDHNEKNGNSVFEGNPTINSIFINLDVNENGENVITFNEDKKNSTKSDFLATIIKKDYSNKQIAEFLEIFKKEGISIEINKLKRNNSNEITEIQLTGKFGKQIINYIQKQNKPINNIYVLEEIGKPETLKFNEHIAKTNNVASIEPLETTEINDNTNLSNKELKTFITKSSNNDDVVVIRKPNGSGVKVPGEPTLNLNENPLIIIDGKPIEGDSEKILNKYDKESIESVDVFKGQKAISAFGEKGKNGVIVVTTKRNKLEKSSSSQISSFEHPDSEQESIELDSNDPDTGWYSLSDAFASRKIKINISNIKRNANNKIIAIDIVMKSADGRIERLNIDRTTPIKSIIMYVDKTKNPNWDFGIKEGKEEINYNH